MLYEFCTYYTPAQWDVSHSSLTIRCKTVPDYPYAITLFVPDGYAVSEEELRYRPDLDGSVLMLTVPGTAEESYQRKSSLKP